MYFFSRVGKCTSAQVSINICPSDWLNSEPDLLLKTVWPVNIFEVFEGRYLFHIVIPWRIHFSLELFVLLAAASKKYIGSVLLRTSAYIGAKQASRVPFWFRDLSRQKPSHTRNVGLVTDIPTAEYLSAWQVFGNLEIAEVLRDYVASNPQREQICLFLSSWLGISKWTQVPGFNVAYAKSTVRHRIDFLNVRNAKNASTLHAQTLVTTNS